MLPVRQFAIVSLLYPRIFILVHLCSFPSPVHLCSFPSPHNKKYSEFGWLWYGWDGSALRMDSSIQYIPVPAQFSILLCFAPKQSRMKVSAAAQLHRKVPIWVATGPWFDSLGLVPSKRVVRPSRLLVGSISVVARPGLQIGLFGSIPSEVSRRHQVGSIPSKVNSRLDGIERTAPGRADSSISARQGIVPALLPSTVGRVFRAPFALIMSTYLKKTTNDTWHRG